MSGLTLALDTSKGTAAAVLDGERVLAERYLENTMLHAEQVGKVIADVLKEAGAKANQVDKVVVGIGPAPFTGLRVGIAAAKLFALGVSARLYSVSSLDAIAYALELVEPTLVLTDARRGEAYFALYQGKSAAGVPIIIQGPGVSRQLELEQDLADRGQSYKVVLGEVSAASIGRLFQASLSEGKEVGGAIANYLRAPDAVPAKGKKVSG